MPQVYIPEPGLYVQTDANEEYPGGRVVHLLPGYNELPPELANHSLIRNLVPEDEAATQRRLKVMQAEQAQAEAVSKAQVEYTAESVKAETEALEAMRKAEDERAKRIDADTAKGITRNEPHPDPEAQRAVSITAAPGAHTMVSAAGMAAKVEPPSAPPGAQPKADETPPAREGAGRRTTV